MLGWAYLVNSWQPNILHLSFVCQNTRTKSKLQYRSRALDTMRHSQMKDIPSNVSPYKKTLIFTERTVPAGLLKNHNTKEGVWGKIVIESGLLEYTIQEPTYEITQLSPNNHGVVEPLIKHYIKPLGPVNFYIEFYR